MSEQADKKTCKMCGMEIPAKARKCPYCHYFQNRWLGVIYHPAFALVAIIPLLAAYGIMMEMMFSHGTDFRPYREQMKVVSPEISFSDDPNYQQVVVVAKVRNDSDRDWKDPIFSVEFYDAAGKLVDGGQDSKKYEYYMAAHHEYAFHVTMSRLFPKESYATCKVAVVHAKDGKAGF
jgi:hypothetical protein